MFINRSMFWSPRFSSWKPEECEKFYATVKEADGTERRILRLVLTHDSGGRHTNGEMMELNRNSTFTLEAGVRLLALYSLRPMADLL